MLDFNYIDIDRNEISPDINLLFPYWKCDDERLCILSPHDDDAVLGAGYAISAAIKNGAEVFIYIFCRGNAGYSTTEEKDTIEGIRIDETYRSYKMLGIREENIVRFNYSDFSVCQSMGWQLNNGQEGSFKDIITSFRKNRITRLLVPNHYREHLDHWAVGLIGTFYAPQAGDPVLVDWNEPQKILSVVQYSTWGDLSPEDLLTKGRSDGLRANRIIMTSEGVEKEVCEAIMEYRSQSDIIKGLISDRQNRKNNRGMYVEVYLSYDPRPKMDYSPYIKLADQLML